MLQLKELSKRLGDFFLNNVNLEIKKGEYFVILGPTGTGKTVVLETIAGMHKPDRGEVWFNGRNLTHLYPEEREIGFVYQDYALFPHLTVQENIVFGLKIRKLPEKEIEKRFREMVKMLEIEHLLERYPFTLSGGEQQRTAIARALVTLPSILLLDEPLSALDPRTKDVFKQELKKIHENMKTTTLHITHDFTEAIYLADRIGVMQEGRIVQVGTPLEVFRRPSSRFVANFVGMENIFEGQVNGDNKVDLGAGVEVEVVSEKKGLVTLTVRPEDVIVSREPFVSSARNSYSGKIIKVINEGPLCKVAVDTGVIFNALVTSRSIEEHKLQPGEEVVITFKSSAVHVF